MHIQTDTAGPSKWENSAWYLFIIAFGCAWTCLLNPYNILCNKNTPGENEMVLTQVMDLRVTYAVVVASVGKNSYKGLDSINSAIQSICMMKKILNAKYDVMVVVAELTEDIHQAFRAVGADSVVDVTDYLDVHELYHPYYGSDTQNRQDGDMTYYKFPLFNMTEYRQIFFFDADVLWQENPDAIFEKTRNSSLVAFCYEDRPQSSQMKYGFNTHAMIIRPDTKRYQNMLFRADTGHYRPFTNTEQDVIESEYAPTIDCWGDEGIPMAPSHKHGFDWQDVKCTDIEIKFND